MNFLFFFFARKKPLSGVFKSLFRITLSGVRMKNNRVKQRLEGRIRLVFQYSTTESRFLWRRPPKQKRAACKCNESAILYISSSSKPLKKILCQCFCSVGGGTTNILFVDYHEMYRKYGYLIISIDLDDCGKDTTE